MEALEVFRMLYAWKLTSGQHLAHKPESAILLRLLFMLLLEAGLQAHGRFKHEYLSFRWMWERTDQLSFLLLNLYCTVNFRDCQVVISLCIPPSSISAEARLRACENTHLKRV